jgi:two-component system cell cycle sensor histidine kinase PleC
MRHARRPWVWVRARAQVVDPEAPNVHLIGIAIDVTEQYHLAMRSEDRRPAAADRDREHLESFVLWDANGRLVMCNTQVEQSGLGDDDVAPGHDAAP